MKKERKQGRDGNDNKKFKWKQYEIKKNYEINKRDNCISYQHNSFDRHRCFMCRKYFRNIQVKELLRKRY